MLGFLKKRRGILIRVFHSWYSLRGIYNRWAIILISSFIISLAHGDNFASFASPQSGANISLHHFDLPCQTCHDAGLNSYNLNRNSKKDSPPLKEEINKLCTLSGCHVLNQAFSHPVGIRPKGQIPADMRLDDYSRITCLTCHEDASSLPNSFGLNEIDSERSLNMPTERNFCAKCHMKLGGTLVQQSHWRFSGKAHLVSMSRQTEYSDSAEFIGGLDTESRTCLSCHTDISGVMGLENKTDHPIGMNYSNIAKQNTKDFKYPLNYDTGIRLFDGQMGCGSCHSLYNRTPNNLVARYERGILCKICHNK
jgi:hypothetical protein